MSRDKVFDFYGAPRKLADWSLRGIPQNLQRQHAELISTGTKWIDPVDASLLEYPEIRTKIWRDPVIAKAAILRQHIVAGTDCYFVARNKESRALVPYFEALLEEIPYFFMVPVQLSRCIFDGDSMVKMLSNETPLKISPDNSDRPWWRPGGMVHISADAIKLAWKEENKVDGAGERMTERQYYWAILDLEKPSGIWYEQENPEWYCHAQYGRDQYSIGYGRGLWESLYFYWYAKTRVFQALLQGVDRFGFPWIWAAIDGQSHFANDAAAANPSARTRAAAIVAEVEKCRKGNTIVTDVLDKLTPIDMNGQGSSAMISILDYLDRVMVELILASSMPTGSGVDTGSLARAEVEQKSTTILTAFDQLVVEEALKNLTKALWKYNLPQWRRIVDPATGRLLSTMQPPRLKLGREKDVDRMENLAVLQGMQAMGMPLSIAKAYEQLDQEQPDADDLVLNPPGAGGPMPGIGGTSANPLTGEPTQGPPLVQGDSVERGSFSGKKVNILTFAEARKSRAKMAEWIGQHKQAIGA